MIITDYVDFYHKLRQQLLQITAGITSNGVIQIELLLHKELVKMFLPMKMYS